MKKRISIKPHLEQRQWTHKKYEKGARIYLASWRPHNYDSKLIVFVLSASIRAGCIGFRNHEKSYPTPAKAMDDGWVAV